MTTYRSAARHDDAYLPTDPRKPDLRLVSSDQKLISGRTIDGAVDQELGSLALKKVRQNAREFTLLFPLAASATYLAGLTAYEQLSSSAPLGDVGANVFAAVLGGCSVYCAYRAVSDWRTYLKNRD